MSEHVHNYTPTHIQQHTSTGTHAPLVCLPLTTQACTLCRPARRQLHICSPPPFATAGLYYMPEGACPCTRQGYTHREGSSILSPNGFRSSFSLNHSHKNNSLEITVMKKILRRPLEIFQGLSCQKKKMVRLGWSNTLGFNQDE